MAPMDNGGKKGLSFPKREYIHHNIDSVTWCCVTTSTTLHAYLVMSDFGGSHSAIAALRVLGFCINSTEKMAT